MCTDTCAETDVESPVGEVKAVVSSLPGCEERNLGSLGAQQAFLTSVHCAAQLLVFQKSSLAEPLHRRKGDRTGRYTSIIQGALAKVCQVWWAVSKGQIKQTPILLATTLLTLQA